MPLSSLSASSLFADVGCQVNIVGIRWLLRCCFRGRLLCVFLLLCTFEIRDGSVVMYFLCAPMFLLGVRLLQVVGSYGGCGTYSSNNIVAT